MPTVSIAEDSFTPVQNALVTKLFIHPVKSCRGIEVSEAQVTPSKYCLLLSPSY